MVFRQHDPRKHLRRLGAQAGLPKGAQQYGRGRAIGSATEEPGAPRPTKPSPGGCRFGVLVKVLISGHAMTAELEVVVDPTEG